jgi:hypothetical protein
MQYGLRAGLALLAGCTFVDVSRPIGVISDGLSDSDAANLAEAAACWNLEFGTQLVAGPDGAKLDQQVVAFYDRATCLSNIAQTQDGWPHSIALCPERYWPALQPSNPYGTHGGLFATPFRVLSHELGHAMNIIGHPSDPLAVMVGGGSVGTSMFRDADHQMFAEANFDFVPHPQCKQVVRWTRAGTGGQVGHCACTTGTPFDLSRPIALVVEPGFELAKSAALATAADCWNLRHGIAIAVRSPEPGDQVITFEPVDSCALNYAVFVRDRDGGILCALPRAPTAIAAYVTRQIIEISNALGASWPSSLHGFDAAEEQVFARAYPDHPVRCHQVAQDPVTGACSCLDPAGSGGSADHPL